MHNVQRVKRQQYHLKTVLKYAGAFIAWAIGSGFATGQEILQFFSSYGPASYGVVLLNLFGFLILGQIIITNGYDHKAERANHFVYFCGKKLGTIYSWLTPVTLVLIMSVLISGAGATLSEYYGINHVIGSALMSVLVLSAYLIGFEKMVRIIAMISPLIITFTLFVGISTVVRDFNQLPSIAQYEVVLSHSQASPNWFISAISYLSLNFFCGSTYFSALGAKAESRSSVQLGAFLGAIALVVTIAIMNTAIMLNAEPAATLAIPTLYLAKKIAYMVGTVFSIVLVLGIFSSSSTMLWAICSQFSAHNTRANRMFAIIMAVGIFFMSLFSFSKLIGVFYPLIGYLGLIFVGAVIRKGFQSLPISRITRRNDAEQRLL